MICVLSHNPQSKAQLTDLAAAIPEGELGKEGIWGVVKYMGNKAKDETQLQSFQSFLN